MTGNVSGNGRNGSNGQNGKGNATGDDIHAEVANGNAVVD